jgi:hypothetical protein
MAQAAERLWLYVEKTTWRYQATTWGLALLKQLKGCLALTFTTVL